MLVGISEIDQQHQKMIDILNRLSDATKNGHADDIIDEIIADLVDYTSYHFLCEEKHFAIHGYPEAKQHCEAHDALVIKLKDIRARYANNEKGISSVIMDLLVDWVFGHIKGSDMKFRDYLKQLNKVTVP